MKTPLEAKVCIVRIINGTQHPALRFQVTIQPEKVNDEYIYIGGTPGDQLVGWWLLEDIVVAKVLGTPTPDGKGWVSE